MDMSHSTKDAEQAERFLTLLKPIEGDLERYCRRLIWQPQELSDALQNAVTKAFAAFDRYRPEASFRAWMLKILTHEAFALNRKHARIARHEFQLEPDELASLPAARTEIGQASSSRPLDEILEPELIAGLKTLTDNERAVLLLRGIGELRYQEISDALGIPLGSVMGNLSRARQKMRAFLGRSERRNTTLRNNDL
jgi:RNA polymerase sigma-70 factor (ECF subfamily)